VITRQWGIEKVAAKHACLPTVFDISFSGSEQPVPCRGKAGPNDKHDGSTFLQGKVKSSQDIITEHRWAAGL
jgi:hypothetical protein